VNVLVRHALAADVEAIYLLGVEDSAFAVSEHIRFYERTELEEWIVALRDNLLLVAEVSDRVVGFLFCKVMSHHWAMLDTLYVHPEWRGKQCGRLLLCKLADCLRERGIVYLSTLAAEDAAQIPQVLERLGFSGARSYRWYEVFLEQSRF
jgi:ribosomal protein S18 acetylase RimI-like enzyme